MHQTLEGLDAGRLERSCTPRPDSILFGTGAPGLERAEVFLSSCAFSPHRHDTYAIGVTTHGVQRFRYRGAQRVALPGQLHVLHPDETHDGAPGTGEGLGYRILYLDPALVFAALHGAPLPFVADPVQPATTATRALLGLLADLEEPIDELARTGAAVTVADALRALCGRPDPGGRVDAAALERVREHLAAHAGEPMPAAALERIAGADRFTIARQFRRAFGTSPDRYRTLRRLELAPGAIEAGHDLARAAVESGFADQSHMSRQFKRAYGLTPARWAAVTRAPGAVRAGASRIQPRSGAGPAGPDVAATVSPITRPLSARGS